MLGSSRGSHSSHLGRYQFQSPSSFIDAGSSTARTMYATKGAAGEDNTPDYYEATPAPKQIWKIDTSHTHGLSARPVEYERRIVGFFDRTLRG